MNWFESIVYGLIVGFSEFIPVSASAQSQILNRLFGVKGSDPLRDLIVHIFSLAALYLVWKNPLETMRRDRAMADRGSRVYNRAYRGNPDLRFSKSAALPMLFFMAIILYFQGQHSILSTVLLLLVNGIIIFLPERLLQGNKTARSMSHLDAWLIGGASALSVLPGLSRVGLCISVALMRGAARKNAVNWAYLLSIPGLILLICVDLIGLIFGGQTIMLSTGFVGYVLLAVSAFGGGYLSVYLIRNMIIHRGLYAFACYSWGAALFAFLLYLL